jgi:hypothetical protein
MHVVCIHVCVYFYIYIHVRAHTQAVATANLLHQTLCIICIHICVYLCIYTYTHARAHTLCTYTHACAHTHIQAVATTSLLHQALGQTAQNQRTIQVCACVYIQLIHSWQQTKLRRSEIFKEYQFSRILCAFSHVYSCRKWTQNVHKKSVWNAQICLDMRTQCRTSLLRPHNYCVYGVTVFTQLRCLHNVLTYYNAGVTWARTPIHSCVYSSCKYVLRLFAHVFRWDIWYSHILMWYTHTHTSIFTCVYAMACPQGHTQHICIDLVHT